MVDFTGGTWRSLIDGSEVSAIPDSVVARYSAKEDERSTGNISTIDDLVGDNDLSGSAEIIEDGVNGNRSYRFDGTESMTDTDFSTTDDFAIFIVAEIQETLDSGNMLFGETATQNPSLQDDSGGVYEWDWDDFDGAQISEKPQPTVILCTLDDGDGAIEVNNQFTDSNSLASNTMDGFEIAGRNDGDEQLEVDVGEVSILDEPSEEDIDNERQRLIDEWDFDF